MLATWDQGDAETMSNLFSSSADLRVLGFDADEQWSGADEFLKVFTVQMDEMPDWSIENHHVEAFEDETSLRNAFQALETGNRGVGRGKNGRKV